MNGIPKISIIIPVYNAETFLFKCVESILIQDFTDYEIILVNDGSSDASGVICDDYAEKHSKIAAFHKTNGGVSSARNMGLEKASGEWILFVDSDDTIETGSLESLSPFLTDDALDLIQFNTTRTDFNFRIKTQLFSSIKEYHAAGYFQPALWNYMFKAGNIRDRNLSFSTGLKYAEDLEFVFKYFADTKTVKTVEYKVYNYLPAETSAMNSIPSALFINNNFSSIERVLDYIKDRHVYKPFYTENMYSFLKYTLRSMAKYSFSDEESTLLEKHYKSVYKKLVSFHQAAIKFLLLDAAYVSLSGTLSLIKTIWH